jgi:hypothetical protein
MEGGVLQLKTAILIAVLAMFTGRASLRDAAINHDMGGMKHYFQEEATPYSSKTTLKSAMHALDRVQRGEWLPIRGEPTATAHP